MSIGQTRHSVNIHTLILSKECRRTSAASWISIPDRVFLWGKGELSRAKARTIRDSYRSDTSVGRHVTEVSSFSMLGLQLMRLDGGRNRQGRNALGVTNETSDVSSPFESQIDHRLIGRIGGSGVIEVKVIAIQESASSITDLDDEGRGKIKP